MNLIYFFFFFSSRRRHTRFDCDWSSDVCSSDLTGLTNLAASQQQASTAFGRFEAGRPNEIWTGDALHAIRVGGRKTYLFAFIDDHSRAVMAARFGFAEDTIRLAAALRP